jgi:hypothetical protein
VKGLYRMPRGWGLDRVAARAPKRLASRYYQLELGQAPIGTYLYWIKAQDSRSLELVESSARLSSTFLLGAGNA